MDRRFGCDFSSEPVGSSEAASAAGSSGVCELIRSQLESTEAEFNGPFGRRRCVYLDYTASGRSVPCIEQLIGSHVLPSYANTHSSASVTAEQSTLYLHEARSVLRNACRASEHDAVLYVSANCTAAVQCLVNGLQLHTPPVVLLGPHEHHSNMLPWRHVAEQMHSVRETDDGAVDLAHLEQLLQEQAVEGVPLIGCFAAASNVTGVRAHVDQITILLHKYGALSFWDYATAAPYVPVEMNPAHDSRAAKDAVYFSGHKFVGGVSTPGVLIAKKSLFRNPTPLRPGGGTVFFVSDSGHSYLREVEYREEGGTPDVVGAVRLALAMRLKLSVGVEHIHAREQRNISVFVDRLGGSKWRVRLRLLGPAPSAQPRLPVFSFVLTHDRLLLHHAFVTVLLNDLFGLQTRSGCMCAGPYAQRLLGIDEPLALEYEKLLQEQSQLDRTHLRRVGEYSDYEMLRSIQREPGFTRLSLPYFLSDADVEHVADCLLFAAEHAWKFLPLYILNRESGEWHHRDHRVFKDRKWLHNWSFTADGLQQTSGHNKESTPVNGGCLSRAHSLQWAGQKLGELPRLVRRQTTSDDGLLTDPVFQRYGWFMLSCEAKQRLLGQQAATGSAGATARQPPFTVRQYVQQPDMWFQAVPSADEQDNGAEKTADPAEPENHEEEDVSLDAEDDLPSMSTVTIQPLAASSQPDTCAAESSDRACMPCLLAVASTSSAGQNVTSDAEDWQQRTVVPTVPGLTDRQLKYKWHAPSKQILKPTMQALDEFACIRPGDRVLVCLSGGKDSLSLLHTLRHVQRIWIKAGNTFQLGAITIDPQSSSYDPSPLLEYARGLNLHYLYERQDIVGRAAALGADCRSICAFCSRMKRSGPAGKGRLYASARQHGYNVLAFGQHLDDLAESFVMSVFANGRLRTMKAHYTVQEQDLRVIRPLVYVREKQLREFAESRQLPVIPENCPACFEQPKERHRIKQMLATQELHNPVLFNSLRAALKPLMAVTSPNTDEMHKQVAENLLKSNGLLNDSDDSESH